MEIKREEIDGDIRLSITEDGFTAKASLSKEQIRETKEKFGVDTEAMVINLLTHEVELFKNKKLAKALDKLDEEPSINTDKEFEPED